MSRGPCPAPRPVNGGEAGRKQLSGSRGFPTPAGAYPRGCGDPRASGVHSGMPGSLGGRRHPSTDARRRLRDSAGGAPALSRATLSPALPLPCLSSAGLESTVASPGPASSPRGSLGTELDEPGRGRGSANRGDFGAGQALLFPRHPAHPAGTWGRASGKDVCVLLRGFGWDTRAQRFPWPPRSRGGHRNSSHQDRQLAIGPGMGRWGGSQAGWDWPQSGKAWVPLLVPAEATNQAGGNAAPSSGCSLPDPAPAPANSPSL